MSGKGSSWSGQWGSGSGEDKKQGSSKRMVEVKAAASAGLDKAKVAAVYGAQKLKTGTSKGIKWIKSQYQKRASK